MASEQPHRYREYIEFPVIHACNFGSARRVVHAQMSGRRSMGKSFAPMTRADDVKEISSPRPIEEKITGAATATAILLLNRNEVE